MCFCLTQRAQRVLGHRGERTLAGRTQSNEELGMRNEGCVGGKNGESMEEERIDFVDLSHARQFASALALHSLNRKGANAAQKEVGVVVEGN